MPLSSDEMLDRVNRYFAAWQSLDATTWSACFTADAVIHQPYGATPIQGAAALKTRFQTIANALQEVTVHAQETHAAHNRAAVLFHGQGIGKNGKSVEVRGINVFEFNDDGQIQTFWAYWDPATVLAKLRG